MPNLLVRDLDKRTIDKLKRRVERHNKSPQGLEEFTRMDWEEFAKRADAFRERLIKSGRTVSDSTEMVREDRDR